MAKVAPGGASLVYAGFIGGTGNDVGIAIAVDAAGAAYVTGATDSTQPSFPVAVGPDLTHNGNFDAFVAKVAPGGATLEYSGFIGGGGTEQGLGIAVDAAGAAYITGVTGSTAASFPEVGGPDLTENGLDDAFVAKVVPAGGSLTYAGFIGGSGGFPVTVGPDLTYNGVGFIDAFVAKVVPGGANLVYAGFIGGDSDDVGNAIAVDAAYVTGRTLSTETTGFPVTDGPDLFHGGGGADAFVAKVVPRGASLAYAGFLGGSSGDEGFGIAVDGAGAAYVTGVTSSSEATFPVVMGPDLTSAGTDAFVAKVASPLSSLPAAVRTSTTWIRGDQAADGAGTFTLTQGTKPLVPMFGDWDGNGSKTPATYEAGTVKLRNDYLGGTHTASFATGFDVRGFAVAGDFNGDGTDDVAVFRNGTWQIRLSTGTVLPSFTFGTGSWPNTVPVVGDWDGNGTDGIGTYNLDTGTWSLRNTADAGAPEAGVFVFWSGTSASYPVVGDWDANGSDTVGVKAGTLWSLRNANAAGLGDIAFNFGLANDLPLSWR